MDKVYVEGADEMIRPSVILKSVQIRFGLEKEEEILMLKRRVKVLEDMVKRLRER